MLVPSVEYYLSVAIEKEYDVESAPGSINIVGWRNRNSRVNYFDDVLAVYRSDGAWWQTYAWPITTFPGRYWLQNLLNPNGTAILKSGCYRSSYELGMYRGYRALRQVKPVKVYRDKNLDSQINKDSDTIEEGLFGIHIHKAGWFSRYVDRWSAGCQAFQEQKNFDKFIKLCEEYAFLAGNQFTYTLIEI